MYLGKLCDGSQSENQNRTAGRKGEQSREETNAAPDTKHRPRYINSEYKTGRQPLTGATVVGVLEVYRDRLWEVRVEVANFLLGEGLSRND